MTFNLVDAPGPKEIAAVVDPLVGLRTKASQFQDLLARLELLSLPYDHTAQRLDTSWQRHWRPDCVPTIA